MKITGMTKMLEHIRKKRLVYKLFFGIMQPQVARM